MSFFDSAQDQCFDRECDLLNSENFTIETYIFQKVGLFTCERHQKRHYILRKDIQFGFNK